MSVFGDTSAIYAGIATDDAVHGSAVDEWTRLLDLEDDLVTDSLIEAEVVAPLQRRIGVQAVAALSDVLLPGMRVVEIDRDRRRADLTGRGAREVSLVDQVFFDLMRRMGITQVFTFDRQFADAGFDLIGSPG